MTTITRAIPKDVINTYKKDPEVLATAQNVTNVLKAWVNKNISFSKLLGLKDGDINVQVANIIYGGDKTGEGLKHVHYPIDVILFNAIVEEGLAKKVSDLPPKQQEQIRRISLIAFDILETEAYATLGFLLAAGDLQPLKWQESTILKSLAYKELMLLSEASYKLGESERRLKYSHEPIFVQTIKTHIKAYSEDPIILRSAKTVAATLNLFIQNSTRQSLEKKLQAGPGVIVLTTVIAPKDGKPEQMIKIPVNAAAIIKTIDSDLAKKLADLSPEKYEQFRQVKLVAFDLIAEQYKTVPVFLASVEDLELSDWRESQIIASMAYRAILKI